MIAFYPGSFDPVTRGHLDVIKRALAFCPELVIGVGQHNQKKYLFSAEERVDLLQQALQEVLSPEAMARIKVRNFDGATVAAAEQNGAKILIKGLRGAADYAYEEKMAIVNRRLNGNLDTVFLFTDNALRDVSSSVVKEMAYAQVPRDKYHHYLTDSVRDLLLTKFGQS